MQYQKVRRRISSSRVSTKTIQNHRVRRLTHNNERVGCNAAHIAGKPVIMGKSHYNFFGQNGSEGKRTSDTGIMVGFSFGIGVKFGGVCALCGVYDSATRVRFMFRCSAELHHLMFIIIVYYATRAAHSNA